MIKHNHWLQSEIPLWLSDGLIDSDQAEQLRLRYPVTGQTAWGRVILSSIGAVVFGLGIILFFAYNWAIIPKFAKLALVFGSLILAHGIGVILRRSGKANRGLSEVMHVLGTMLFGAGIWLIAQIYHLDEHYPNALLVWGLGALLFAWAIPSIAHGIIAVVLFQLWSGFEVFEFQAANRLGPFIVLFGLMPLAWLRRSRILLFLSLSGFLLQLTFCVISVDEWLTFYLIFFTTSLILAIAAWLSDSAFPAGVSIVRFVTLLVYFVLLYLLTHDLPSPSKALPEVTDRFVYLLVLVPFFMATVVWLVVFVSGRWRLSGVARGIENLLIFSTSVALLLVHYSLFKQQEWMLILIFNCLFIVHSLILIVDGTQQVSLRRVTVGCCMLFALLAARFTDLFDSLLMRSLMFLVLGAGLFIVGIFYSRQRDKKDAARA